MYLFHAEWYVTKKTGVSHRKLNSHQLKKKKKKIERHISKGQGARLGATKLSCQPGA